MPRDFGEALVNGVVDFQSEVNRGAQAQQAEDESASRPGGAGGGGGSGPRGVRIVPNVNFDDLAPSGPIPRPPTPPPQPNPVAATPAMAV